MPGHDDDGGGLARSPARGGAGAAGLSRHVEVRRRLAESPLAQARGAPLPSCCAAGHARGWRRRVPGAGPGGLRRPGGRGPGAEGAEMVPGGGGSGDGPGPGGGARFWRLEVALGAEL